MPTLGPTSVPTRSPTFVPTPAPSSLHPSTASPSSGPTKSPTPVPTLGPTSVPTTLAPTTGAPTVAPGIASVTLSGTLVLAGLPVFSIGLQPISSWFDTSGPGVETPPLIETDNGAKISFAAVENHNGLYVAVIYDAKSANGGIAGSVTVVATCAGLPCLTSDFVAAVNPLEVLDVTPLSLTWPASEENGFVVGPFTKGEEACFLHSAILPLALLGGIDDARFVDGSNTDHNFASNASLLSNICIRFS